MWDSPQKNDVQRPWGPCVNGEKYDEALFLFVLWNMNGLFSIQLGITIFFQLTFHIYGE
jgi:hypothetical protein